MQKENFNLYIVLESGKLQSSFFVNSLIVFFTQVFTLRWKFEAKCIQPAALRGWGVPSETRSKYVPVCSVATSLSLTVSDGTPHSHIPANYVDSFCFLHPSTRGPSIQKDTSHWIYGSNPKKLFSEGNRHVVPGRHFWRRPDSSERRAGLNSIAALWDEGSSSSGGAGQASNGGTVQHDG